MYRGVEELERNMEKIVCGNLLANYCLSGIVLCINIFQKTFFLRVGAFGVLQKLLAYQLSEILIYFIHIFMILVSVVWHKKQY
jgi:hypothetical protein